MQTAQLIAKAFWSSGRKMFLPLTIDDAVNRLDLPRPTVEILLADMVAAGMVQHRTHNIGGQKVSIWNTTAQGKKAAQGAIE